MAITLPLEVIETRRKLFVDYCNQRDQVKKRMGRNVIRLTQDQSQRVLRMARIKHHRREMECSAAWYDGYKKNVQRFLTAVCVKSWPNFREM